MECNSQEELKARYEEQEAAMKALQQELENERVLR